MMQAAELAVLDWLQAHLRCDFLDAVMPWISRICDHGEIWILLAAVLLLLRKHRWTGMSLSFALILVISLPLGILAARYEGGVLDKILTVLNQITMSIPNFLLGFLLTCVFSLILHWFTVGSFSAAAEQGLGAYLSYLFFPALAIALPKAAMTVKMLRGSILGEMKEDYIRTAYSKGNSKSAALWRFALRTEGHGKALPFYLLLYAPVRFLLEFLRGDAVRGIWFGLSTSQWLSLALFAFCASALCRNRKKRTSKCGGPGAPPSV